MRRRELALDLPFAQVPVVPPDRGLRLVGRPDRAVGRADRLDLVEVAGVLVAGERWRAGRAEHRCAGDDERLEVPHPRPVIGIGRRGGPPLAGLGADRPGRVAERPVVLPGADHRGGGLAAHGDPSLLRDAVGDRGQPLVVLRLQAGPAAPGTGS